MFIQFPLDWKFRRKPPVGLTSCLWQQGKFVVITTVVDRTKTNTHTHDEWIVGSSYAFINRHEPARAPFLAHPSCTTEKKLEYIDQSPPPCLPCIKRGQQPKISVRSVGLEKSDTPTLV